MKIIGQMCVALATTGLVAGTAFAGGLDRSVFSPGILFEEGNYAKLTIAHTNPKVSPTALPGAEVANTFVTGKLEFKTQLNDKFALAILLNNQPVGADIDYASTGIPLTGEVKTFSTIVLAKYAVTDRFSVYGGAKHQKAEGTADLTAIGGLPLNFNSQSKTGLIAGVAYEIQRIKLRVSLSYESKISYALATAPSAAPGLILGSTTAATPAAFTLEFQSGIAPDTLLFGRIRHAKWSDANIFLPAALGGTALSSFGDITNYTLGIGRKLNDNWSVQAALNYEPKEGGLSGAFAPTDGIKGISLGAKYTKGKMSISGGVNYSKRGDTTTVLGTPFSGNSVLTAGVSNGVRL